MHFRIAYIHWLNLDLIAGALATQAAFISLPEGHLPAQVLLQAFTGLILFGMLLLNRLWTNSTKRSSPKAFFFKTHYQTLLAIAIAALTFSALLSWYLPETFRLPAFILTAMGASQLLSVRFLSDRPQAKAWQEVLASTLLVIFVWGSCRLQNPEEVWLLNSSGIILYGIVLQNTLVLSHFDMLRNKKNTNLARKLGKTLTSRLVVILSILIIAGIIFLCLHSDFRYAQRLAVLMGIISLLNCWIFRYYGGYRKNEDFRMIVRMTYLIIALAI